MATVSVEEATSIALARATDAFERTRASRVLDPVPVAAAHGRVLAENVCAIFPHPRHVTSIMDGYAINARETLARGAVEDVVVFREVVSEASRAGDAGARAETLGRCACAYVTTGAVLPPGCDAVAPQEICTRTSEGHVAIPRDAIVEGKWVRAAGSDIEGRGETLIAQGTRVRATDVGLMKYATDEVSTYAPPRVRILSTGDELTQSARDDAAFGSSVDTNGPMLQAFCDEQHAEVLSRSVIRDDEAETAAAFMEALNDADCDVLITSGGASVGDRDFVAGVIKRLGGEIHFRRMAMKPGKPTTFATIDRERAHPLLVFALPGNPVSAAVTFTLVVAPCLAVLSGCTSAPSLRRLHCVLAETLSLDVERPEYHRAVLDWTGGESSLPIARSTGRQISSRLLSMRRADVLLELPRGPGSVEKGAVVSALVVSDLRYADVRMEKITSPRRGVVARQQTPSNRSTTFVSILQADGVVRDLKRAIGLEEAVRRRCFESAEALLTPVSVYSDGDTHVAVMDGQPTALKRAVEAMAKRMRFGDDAAAITHRAFARVGIIGNPSDGYGGKCIAAAVSNWHATATLTPTPNSRSVTFLPGKHDSNEFSSFDELSSTVALHGVDGGVRLLKSLCENVKRYCLDTRQSIDFSVGFRMQYSTSIPKQLGLSGSSAIVIAALRCLLQHYGVSMSMDEQAALALRVESDVGITAGPMDRVSQVYNGVVFMDFSRSKSCENASGLVVHGEYTRLNSALLPPLHLVWADENASHSGKVHSTLRARWDNRHISPDAELIESMHRLATLAEEVLSLFEAGGHIAPGALIERMHANFEARRRLFGDAVLGARNLKMVEVCREAGCGAKFAGSGGALVVVAPDEASSEALRRACAAHGFKLERLVIAD